MLNPYPVNMDKKKVIIYTDGACSGNPGPGGWAAVMMYENKSIFSKNVFQVARRTQQITRWS